MANGELRASAKHGLPAIISATVCGYATNLIPHLFSGDYKDWAYRAIPALSLAVLFVIKLTMDVGSMSIAKIMFSICANPEKKNLKIILDDTHADDDTKSEARKKYQEILTNEMEIGSRIRSYFSQLPIMSKPPAPPPPSS